MGSWRVAAPVAATAAAPQHRASAQLGGLGCVAAAVQQEPDCNVNTHHTSWEGQPQICAAWVRYTAMQGWSQVDDIAY